MVRWVNSAMSFAMVFAIIAVFAVKLQCVLCVSINALQAANFVEPKATKRVTMRHI